MDEPGPGVAIGPVPASGSGCFLPVSGLPTGVGFVSSLFTGNGSGGVPGKREPTGSSLTTTGFFKVTNSMLVEVGFGGGRLFGEAANDEKKAARLCVEHGVAGKIRVGGGVGEPTGIVTVKFESVTVRLCTTRSVKGSCV